MKVLYLHGFGESSLLAGMSTKDLGEVLKAGGHQLLADKDGFQKLKTNAECEPIVDKEYREMVQAGDLDAFSWYPLKKPTEGQGGGHRSAPYEDFGYRSNKAEVTVAVTKLVEYITTLGGVDAIMGFSQGGELAYCLCEHLGKPDVNVPWADKLKFVGTFGSEDPFNQRGEAPVAIKRDVIFFICYGSKDLDAEHDSQTCSKSLEAVGARAVVTHKVEGLDHHMPKKADAVGKAAYDKMLSELANSVKAFTPAPAPAPAAPPPGKSIRAIDNLMNDPNTKMFTWEIPPEAPPGWGRGYENGEAYLIEHCGLYRPEHPKWKELHPEGVEEYWKKKNAEDPRNRNKTVEVS